MDKKAPNALWIRCGNGSFFLARELLLAHTYDHHDRHNEIPGDQQFWDANNNPKRS